MVQYSNLQFACGLHGSSSPLMMTSFAVMRHCRTESRSHVKSTVPTCYLVRPPLQAKNFKKWAAFCRQSLQFIRKEFLKSALVERCIRIATVTLSWLRISSFYRLQFMIWLNDCTSADLKNLSSEKEQIWYQNINEIMDSERNECLKEAHWFRSFVPCSLVGIGMCSCRRRFRSACM